MRQSARYARGFALQHTDRDGTGQPGAPAPTHTPGLGATSPTPSIRVVSSRLAYPWHWPNDPARPGRVAHSYPVPPMPELVRISVGYHPGEHGQLPYNRMSFTFTQAFPSYHFEWAASWSTTPAGRWSRWPAPTC